MHHCRHTTTSPVHLNEHFSIHQRAPLVITTLAKYHEEYSFKKNNKVNNKHGEGRGGFNNVNIKKSSCLKYVGSFSTHTIALWKLPFMEMTLFKFQNCFHGSRWYCSISGYTSASYQKINSITYVMYAGTDGTLHKYPSASLTYSINEPLKVSKGYISLLKALQANSTTIHEEKSGLWWLRFDTKVKHLQSNLLWQQSF